MILLVLLLVFFVVVVVVVLVELVVVVEVALIGLDVAVVIGVLSLAMNDSLWLISLVYHIKVDEVLVFVLGSVFLWVGLMVVVVMMSVGVVTSHSRVPEGFFCRSALIKCIPGGGG